MLGEKANLDTVVCITVPELLFFLYVCFENCLFLKNVTVSYNAKLLLSMLQVVQMWISTNPGLCCNILGMTVTFCFILIHRRMPRLCDVTANLRS